jgi:hypothetical protein
MHGIICDGGASKFSCLVEWLNLVLYVEDYRLVQNAALSGGDGRTTQEWPARGVGKATNNGLHFRGICTANGSVACPENK